MGLTRGDIVTVVLASEYAKPRPAVVVQSDLFDSSESVVVVPITSDLHDDAALFRMRIEPSAHNRLLVSSDLMIDKMSAIPRTEVGYTIGRLHEGDLLVINAKLALFLGL